MYLKGKDDLKTLQNSSPRPYYLFSFPSLKLKSILLANAQKTKAESNPYNGEAEITGFQLL